MTKKEEFLVSVGYGSRLCGDEDKGERTIIHELNPLEHRCDCGLYMFCATTDMSPETGVWLDMGRPQRRETVVEYRRSKVDLKRAG
jgi:hypothetical protein